MKTREQLVDEGIINDNKVIGYKYIAGFYKEQLKKFKQLGIGKTTEFDITVTDKLINVTEKRLRQIRPMIEASDEKL